jgi:hypothetical protein
MSRMLVCVAERSELGGPFCHPVPLSASWLATCPLESELPHPFDEPRDRRNTSENAKISRCCTRSRAGFGVSGDAHGDGTRRASASSAGSRANFAKGDVLIASSTTPYTVASVA